MQLVLIRSCGTAWHDGAPTTDDCRIQGAVPLPLSDEGKAILRQIADELGQLGAETIVSSGNESSGATADYLAQLCELKTRKFPELRELDCGIWQGLRISEIKDRFSRAYKQWLQDPTSLRPPQGESLDELAQRVDHALLQIIRKFRGKTVALVAAHIVAGVVECRLTARPLNDLWHVASSPENFRVLTTSDADDQPVEGSGRLLHQATFAQNPATEQHDPQPDA